MQTGLISASLMRTQVRFPAVLPSVALLALAIPGNFAARVFKEL